MFEWFKKEIREIKTLFRKHDYVFVRGSITFGESYVCRKCKEQLYLPSDWVGKIDIKKIQGCKGEKKCSISHMN